MSVDIQEMPDSKPGDEKDVRQPVISGAIPCQDHEMQYTEDEPGLSLAVQSHNIQDRFRVWQAKGSPDRVWILAVY